MDFLHIVCRRSSLSLVASLAALGVGAPVLAGDLGAPAPETVVVAAVPVVPTYDWGGGYAGAQVGYGWADVSPNVDSADSWIGGLNGGYRWDFGQWVAGAELSFDWTDFQLEGTDEDATVTSIFAAKVSAGIETGPALVYVTAGWGQAEADGNFDALIGGLGVAYPINERWVASGEWLYYDFDDVNLGADSVGWGNTITARIAYRF